MIDFDKQNGLIPAIIQDYKTKTVLMLGYMNHQSYEKTKETGLVTFFSRSRNELWTKGETSGNFLKVKSMDIDCDQDTLLVQVAPVGPVCHTGTDTCFNKENKSDISFLTQLEAVLEQRKGESADSSYTASLYAKGIKKIAQKVGEEAVETVIEAVAGDTELMKEEAADLIYHLLVLLKHYDMSLTDIVKVLEKRH